MMVLKKAQRRTGGDCCRRRNTAHGQCVAKELQNSLSSTAAAMARQAADLAAGTAPAGSQSA